MPVEPIDVYEFGNTISNDYNTEAAKRSAVSGIYYGVFLSVRGRFSVSTRSRRSHQDARIALAKGTRRQTGDYFGDLQALRQERASDVVCAETRPARGVADGNRGESVWRIRTTVGPAAVSVGPGGKERKEQPVPEQSGTFQLYGIEVISVPSQCPLSPHNRT